MVAMQLAPVRHRHAPAGVAVARRQRTQRVEDHGHVDHLLDDRRRHRQQPTQRRRQHRQHRKPHACDDALDRDPPRPLRDHDRLADPVEAIGEDHHIGRLRRGAGAAGAERDPDIGRGQRRRIVDTVADHDGRMQPLLGAHRVDLVGGHPVGQHRIEIERGADRMRGGGAVAGDHDHARNAGVAQQPDRPRRVGAKLVGQQQGADRPPLDRDEDDQRRPPRTTADRPRGPFARAGAAIDHVARAGGHLPPVDHALQSRTDGFPYLLGHPESQAALDPGLDDGGGEHVMRGLLQRGTQHQHFLRRLSRRDLDRKQPRAADRQRSGLVEQYGMGARQSLQRPAALDQDAAPSGLRNAGDEGDGSRQNQRTRRRRHQHREAADQIARDQPGGEGKYQRHRQEDQGIAVGQPHERRLGGLRRGHQAHDARIGAFARGRRHRQLKGLAGIQRAGQDGGAARLDHRDRLAGQRRFVDRGRGRADDAVDRNDFAGAYQQPVADRDLGYRHFLDTVTGAAMGFARRAVDQRAQIMLGAGHRDIL